jgi:chemotaxis protein MotA
MDIATLLGVGLGLLLISSAIFLGGSPGSFVDIPSLMITVGGTLSAILISYPAHKVKAVFSVAKKTLQNTDLDVTPWYRMVVEVATVARREGVLALEERLDQIGDEFLRRGLQMVVDGSQPETVRGVLEDEIEKMEERHQVGHSIFKNMGSYAPAFGMIGTLIGLVQMLQNLEDPSKIGSGMATALLTTFYGAFFANLFCIPMRGKLEQRTQEEMTLKQMLLAGVLAIQSGDSPRIVGEKLLAFLPPHSRKGLEH